jgi:aminoglycoside 3-N-acetyltransferase
MPISPLEMMSGWALRLLPAAGFAQLRQRYLGARRALAPALKAIHGEFNVSDLSAHLEQRIGRDFEILVVHSSLNAMQPMFSGTALDLVRMLQAYCGTSRTLVMPAFYFGDPEIGGAAETFARRPRFDLRRTPSQMGLATELFRRSPGVLQSRNPIYRFAALGPHAQALVAGHEASPTLCGIGTPFEYIDRHDSVILGVGKTYDILTHVHHAEATLADDFPVPRASVDPLAMTLVDGNVEIGYALPRGGFAWKRDMALLGSIMTTDELKCWKFHAVPMFATRAAQVTVAIKAAAQRGLTIYRKA